MSGKLPGAAIITTAPGFLYQNKGYVTVGIAGAAAYVIACVMHSAFGV